MDKVQVSKQVSYLLRHDPEGLGMDEKGFVSIDELIEKLENRFEDIDEEFLREELNKEKRRYQIKNGKIRALYGHTLDLDLDLPEADKKILYHGTTERKAKGIMKNGLLPRDRQKVHLSATRKGARKVGLRRTDEPTILKIDTEKASRDGIKITKATGEIYLSEPIPPQYIKKT